MKKTLRNNEEKTKKKMTTADKLIYIILICMGIILILVGLYSTVSFGDTGNTGSFTSSSNISGQYNINYASSGQYDYVTITGGNPSISSSVIVMDGNVVIYNQTFLTSTTFQVPNADLTVYIMYEGVVAKTFSIVQTGAPIVPTSSTGISLFQSSLILFGLFSAYTFAIEYYYHIYKPTKSSRKLPRGLYKPEVVGSGGEEALKMAEIEVSTDEQASAIMELAKIMQAKYGINTEEIQKRMMKK